MRAHVLLGITLGWALCSSAHALTCSPEDEITFHAASLRIENDLFINTDRDYTSGVSVALVSRDISGPLRSHCLPLWADSHARLIEWVDADFWAEDGRLNTRQNIVLRLGQQMYTPRDPHRSDLIVEDRPYAGLLMSSLAWNRRWVDPLAGVQVLDTREIGLGLMGPASMAKASQNAIHHLIGSPQFQGWHHQLKNEPAVLVAAERKVRSDLGGAKLGWSSDMVWGYGLRLGNVETSTVGSIEGRFGWNLPNDFGTYPIRPGADNRPPLRPLSLDRASPWGMHGFALLETKLVAWDFSLDGNLFHNSHSVQKRIGIAQLAVGLSLQTRLADQGFKLAIMRVFKTPEFKGQVGRHGYISLLASLEWDP